MRRGSLVIKELPGNLFDNVFKDVAAGTIMAVSTWESQEALQAAMPPFREALKEIPFDEWETHPRELKMLNSVIDNPPPVHSHSSRYGLSTRPTCLLIH